MRYCGLLFAALVLLTAASGLAPANEEEKPPVPLPVSVPEDVDKVSENIRDVLERSTAMDFVDTPLSEVMAFLKDFHQIQIQFDQPALEETGVAIDTPVTRDLKGIELRSALRLLLEPLDLTYVVKNQVLLITSLDVASEMLERRAYPVADLVRKPDGSADYSGLIRVITSTIKPDSWEEAGGPARIVPYRGTLVIGQLEAVHDDIAKLLRMLRSDAAVAARESISENSSAAKASPPNAR